MSLSTCILLYNTEKILYPWRESIMSALPVSDQVILMACHDMQAEWDALTDFLDSLPEVESRKILPLKGLWGTTSNVIAELQNDCLKYVTSEWYLSLQADEILHEDGYKELAWLQRQPNFTAAKVRFVHYVADFNTTFDFIYSSVPRLGKVGYNWKNVGDGVQLDGGQGPVWNSRIELHHVGKVHVGRRKEAVEKEFAFQQLFIHLNMNFPDPLIVEARDKYGELDYHEIFKAAKDRGEFRPFTGNHPKAMLPYIERMEALEEEWKVKSGL